MQRIQLKINRYLSLAVLTICLFTTNFVFPHTNSLCYVNAGPGSVTFWYGNWHASTNFVEGEFKIEGINGNSYAATKVAFNQLATTTPAGCVSGTNYFNSGPYHGTGAGLVPYGPANGGSWQSYRWQGVTFTGLNVGDYQFSYIPLGHTESSWPHSAPTADWDPIAGFSLNTLTLDSGAVGSTLSLESSIPTDNTSNLNITVKTLQLTFDKAVKAGTGTIKIKKTGDDSTVETFDVTGARVTGWGGETITVTWTTNLTHSTSYYVVIDNGAILDNSDNAFAGISDKTALNFTTIGQPYLTASTPADNSTGVTIDTTRLVLTFNENVVVGTGLIKIKKRSDNSTVESIDVTSGQVTGWGTTQITVSWTDYLSISTDYYVEIASGAIQNPGSVVYTGISDNWTLNYSTSPDGLLILTGSTPADNATSVSPQTTSLVLNFNENVTIGTGKITIKKASDESIVESIDVTSSNTTGAGTTTITVTWLDWLAPSTTYFVNIPATAFKNSQDEIYVGINNQTSLNFTTSASNTNPWDDKDVIALVEAQAEIAHRRVDHSLRPILERIEWFRRNRHKNNISKQGVEFNFQHTEIEKLITSEVNTVLNAIEQEFLSLILPIDLNPEGELFEEDWALWTSGSITVGKVAETNHSSNKSFQTDGITLGIDKKLNSREFIGGVLRFGLDDTKVGNLGSRLQTQDYGMAFYRSWNFTKNYFFDLVVGYNKLDMETTREHSTGTIKGKRIGHQVYESITVNKQINYKKLFLTPYSRLDIAYTELRPYEESGTNAALAFGEQKLNLTKVNVGLLADYQWFTWIGKLRPYGRLEYSGDLSNSTRPTASYINERSVVYETKLHDFRANSWHLGLGIDFDFYLGWFTASYERTEEAEDNNNHQIDRKSDTIRLKMLIRF